MDILNKIGEWLKNKINSIKIPPLLSFFITKDGIKNPTLEESQKDAEPSQNNWLKIGFGAISPLGIPYWQVVFFPVLILVLAKSSDFIVFGIEYFFAAWTFSLSISLGQNSLIILALDSLKNSLIFLISNISKLGAVIFFGWMLYKIYLSWGKK